MQVLILLHLLFFLLNSSPEQSIPSIYTHQPFPFIFVSVIPKSYTWYLIISSTISSSFTHFMYLF